MPPRRPARRRVIAISATAGAVICLLAGAEIAAHTVADDALSAAVPAGVTVAPAGSAAWGMLTGSIAVTVRIDQAALTSMLGDRAESVQIDDAILVSTTRTTPIGEVPIEVELTPVVENGALAVQVVEAQVDGMSLPGSALGGLGAFTLSDPAGDVCGGLTATSAAVDGDTLVVEGSMPLNVSGTTTC